MMQEAHRLNASAGMAAPVDDQYRLNKPGPDVTTIDETLGNITKTIIFGSARLVDDERVCRDGRLNLILPGTDTSAVSKRCWAGGSACKTWCCGTIRRCWVS
jgi:hypothetical protein